jgi:hypothetical protein
MIRSSGKDGQKEIMDRVYTTSVCFTQALHNRKISRSPFDTLVASGAAEGG